MWRGRCRACGALPGGVGSAGVSGPDEGAAGPARRCRTAWASPLNLQPQKKHNIWKKPLCTWYSGFFRCEKLGFRAGGSTEWRSSSVGFRWCAAPRLRTWCLTPRNPLFFRPQTPRLSSPKRRRRTGRGASLPANPYSFAHKHHVSRVKGAGGVPDVVPHSPQTLIPSSGSTTSLGSKAPAAYRTWCLTPRKPLFLRPEAPRPQVRMGRRPHRRGALSPTNPCSFVRKHHVPRSGWADAGTDVVLHPPQTLVFSSGSTTSPGPDGPTPALTWCFTPRNDVLPVNRTMKKYKICVTIILNFLLVIF